MIALESAGMDRQVLAGSLFSGIGEQASGRVDVTGKDTQQQAAAASMVSGLCLEATKGVQTCQFFQESNVSPVTPDCSLLVRSLSGRTLVCSLPAGFTVDDLERCISEYTVVPRSSFFLTIQGRMISALSLLSCMADYVGVPHFQELGCAMFAMHQGAGPRKVAVSGVVMPEIHVLLPARLVPHPSLVVKKPILDGLLEPKLLL